MNCPAALASASPDWNRVMTNCTCSVTSTSPQKKHGVGETLGFPVNGPRRFLLGGRFLSCASGLAVLLQGLELRRQFSGATRPASGLRRIQARHFIGQLQHTFDQLCFGASEDVAGRGDLRHGEILIHLWDGEFLSESRSTATSLLNHRAWQSSPARMTYFASVA